MKSFKEFLKEKAKDNPCWDGYEQYGTKKKNGKEVPNCIPEEDEEDDGDEELYEAKAEYKGRKVTLNKPFRNGDGKSKFSVYVKNDKGNVVKVNFGDPDMEIKKDDPERRKSFRARHNCDQKKDKTTAGYWSCRSWSDNEDWV